MVRTVNLTLKMSPLYCLHNHFKTVVTLNASIDT